MQSKFPGIHRIDGTIYNNMNCDEALRKIYAHIADNKKTKKLDTYFSIIAKHCYTLDDSATKSFHSEITNKYSNVSWDDAIREIRNKLPKYSNLPLEVAVSIIVDTCRKADTKTVK